MSFPQLNENGFACFRRSNVSICRCEKTGDAPANSKTEKATKKIKKEVDETEGEKEDDDDNAAVDSDHEDYKPPKKNKKRKTKTEESEDSGTEKKSKEKKPRVSEKKAQEAYEKILKEMAKNYNFGMTELPLATVAANVGYKNVRSDAVAAARKLMAADDKAVYNKGNVKFTERGIEEFVTAMKPAANPKEALEMFWNHFEAKLSNTKNATSDKARESARSIFDKLADGKAYTKKQLLEVTHYGMERSTGFPETLKALAQINLTQTVDGKIAFDDKLFPFGRP